jgi:hypothetical protein
VVAPGCESWDATREACPRLLTQILIDDDDYAAAMSGVTEYERYLAQRRPCRDVYGGTCKTYIGPPDWDHRINRYRDAVKKHPTVEQALVAAQDPNTLPEVLLRLGDWDVEQYGDVSRAAHNNPSYPAR